MQEGIGNIFVNLK